MNNNLSNSATSKQSSEYKPEMPHRWLILEFYIDTNRINARQHLPNMNTLEQWHAKGIISIQMPEEVRFEALKGDVHNQDTIDRINKAKQYICSIVPSDMHKQYRHIVDQIERILFPSGMKTSQEITDVRIAFNAGYYQAILVTNDGDSKRQPNGILGNRNALAQLGITVVRDSEAVSLVREAIKSRDERAKTIAEITGQPLPVWVGAD